MSWVGWLPGLLLAAALAATLPEAVRSQSLKDRVIHNQCSAKLTREMVSKGITRPAPTFISKVCDCVVTSVNGGETTEQAKKT